MKAFFLPVFFVFAFSISFVFAQQEPPQNEPINKTPVFGPISCQAGGLTASVHKNYQMLYPDEDFIRINDIDALKDVSQLKGLDCLQYLDATGRAIKGDIANLKDLKNLEAFSLYSNPEVHGGICSLAGAVKLRSLKFAFDPNITGDISCLENLTKLETFAMTHTNISGDISVFANMPNLKAIYVSGTYVRGDICAFSKLGSLQEMGIADEYPGNPDIWGDLSCLDNLQKLKKVSIYNTNTANCGQFTKTHPNIAQMGPTESGKPAGGGCSNESMKTLVDVAHEYERKIGKEKQTEVRGKSDYNKGGEEPPKECIANGEFIGEENCRALMGGTPKGVVSGGYEKESKGAAQLNIAPKEPGQSELNEPGQRDIITTIIDWIKSLFGWVPERSTEAGTGQPEGKKPGQGPPEECIISGKFIGEEKCRAMMEKKPRKAGQGLSE